MSLCRIFVIKLTLKNMADNYKVYYLCSPIDMIPVYYGQTKQSLRTRLHGHINTDKEGNNKPKTAWIKMLKEANLTPRIEFIESYDTRLEALAHETKLILEARRDNKFIFNYTTSVEALNIKTLNPRGRPKGMRNPNNEKIKEIKQKPAKQKRNLILTDSQRMKRVEHLKQYWFKKGKPR